VCVCVCVCARARACVRAVGKGVGVQHVLYSFIHEQCILKGTRCTVSPSECEETYIAALCDM